MYNKKISIILGLLIVSAFLVNVYADDVQILLDGIVHVLISVPYKISAGDLIMGDIPKKVTLFSINSVATGATFNLTLLNGTQNVAYTVYDPQQVPIPLQSNIVKEVAAKQGNYTLEITPTQTGAISGMVVVQLNQSIFNITRY